MDAFAAVALYPQAIAPEPLALAPWPPPTVLSQTNWAEAGEAVIATPSASVRPAIWPDERLPASFVMCAATATDTPPEQSFHTEVLGPVSTPRQLWKFGCTSVIGGPDK